MPHFIIQNGVVECPACGVLLIKQREQDRRVWLMRHEGSRFCSLHNRLFRIDRLNGYSEGIHEA